MESCIYGNKLFTIVGKNKIQTKFNFFHKFITSITSFMKMKKNVDHSNNSCTLEDLRVLGTIIYEINDVQWLNI